MTRKHLKLRQIPRGGQLSMALITRTDASLSAYESDFKSFKPRF
jgi:hypothetical protein